jgi:hypothetical protein
MSEKFVLRILEGRERDVHNAAAVMREDSKVPPNFATIDTISLSPPTQEMLGSFFDGNLDGSIIVTRSNLSILLALVGRDAYQGGVQRGQQLSEMFGEDS